MPFHAGGRLQQVVQEYRAQLLAKEEAAQRALDYAHRQTLVAINQQLDALYRLMEQKYQLDGQVPVEWLYENYRLQTIMSMTSGKIDQFGALAQAEVGSLQRWGVQLGTQAGMAVLDAAKPLGIAWTFGIPSQAALVNLIGATQAGSPLATLFNGFGQEAAQKVKQALLTGLTLGDNPRTVAPLVQQALGVSRARALTIARTEMLRSYRDANTETYRANSDVVDQWRWTAALSSNTCAACLGEDGTLHDLDEDMESHPNCRCAPIPVTKSWDDILGPLGIVTSDIPDSSPIDDMQSGSDWFAEQPAEVQQSILGKAKFQAFQDGQFQLSDVVGHAHDKDWGNSIYERSLADTLKAADTAARAAAEEAVAALSAPIDHLLEESVPELARDLLSVEAQAALAAEEAAKAEQAIKDAEAQAAQTLKKSEAAKKGAATQAANKAAKLAAQQAQEEAAQLAAQEAATLKDFTPLTGTLAEKEQFLRDNGYGPWMDSLSVAERQQIQGYTGGIYNDMNSFLRTGNSPAWSQYTQADLQRRIDLVQSALLQSSAPTDLLNVRGYGYGTSLLSAFQSALESGDPFIEKGFCSTTILDNPTFGGIRLTIQIPEGSPGAYIKPVSNYPGEQEYLLPYGAVFKITGATQDENGRWSFYAEYIGIADA